MNQGEARGTLETFWRNVYLRGQMIFDPEGTTGLVYGQPQTGLPFGRLFVIGPDQVVELPTFGHNPTLIIDTIYELLNDLSLPGDLDDDGDVDMVDLGIFVDVLLGQDSDPAHESRADLNGDQTINGDDIQLFIDTIMSP